MTCRNPDAVILGVDSFPQLAVPMIALHLGFQTTVGGG
jgi:hypothetical protein